MIEDEALCRTAADLLPDPPDYSAWVGELKRATGRSGRALFHPLRLALDGARAWTRAQSPANAPAPRDRAAPPARRDRLSFPVTLQLHNTLTRKKEAFAPIDPSNVRMYVCGPTVYQRIHIGNARPLIVFDVLYRLLRHLYGEQHVTYVRNITDIDDKIIDQARKNGEPIEALTERTYQAYQRGRGGPGLPAADPRAARHRAHPRHGGADRPPDRQRQRLRRRRATCCSTSRRCRTTDACRAATVDDQIAGARVDVAPYKRDPADFVLWKPSTPEQPGWDSPWGRGRPGWHIECSAMSEELLGVPFDIHGGGLDLIFPHHENEIAQTRCAHHLDRMANIWLHNGFVDMRGEKMSKSVGNVLRLDEALKIVPGEAIRFLMLSTHYRQPIDCNDEALREAKRTLGSILLGTE